MIWNPIRLIGKATFLLFQVKIYPWVKKSLISFGQIINILLFSKFNPTINKIKIEGKTRCYILGNGPSLRNNLDNNLKFLSECSLIVVNDMSVSEYFELLKPEYYVLADPSYWDKNIYKELADNVNLVLESIRDKTNWPMYLIIPYMAYKDDNIRDFFKLNKNIKLVYYNLLTFNGFEVLNKFVYKHNLGMPKPQNVIIPSIIIAININFKEINLLGVDHSWTQNLLTNDENEVCFIDTHFYDDQNATIIPFRKINGEIYKMHQILIDFSLMFEGYHIVNRYAEYRDVKVYNMTKHSFIDAFERKYTLN